MNKTIFFLTVLLLSPSLYSQMSNLPPSVSGVVRTDGETSTAKLYLGASKNNATTYSKKFYSNEKITIKGKIDPSSEDLGAPAQLFVVMRKTEKDVNTFFALNESNQWVLWNARIKDLPIYKEVAELSNKEEVEIFSGTIDSPKVLIYFGYSTSSNNSRPVIHTNSSPLKLEIIDSVENKYKIDLKNYTIYDDEKLLPVIQSVYDSASDSPRNIRVFTWPIGTRIREGTIDGSDVGNPFNTHQVLMSDLKFNQVKSDIEEWIVSSCTQVSASDLIKNNDSPSIQDSFLNIQSILKYGSDAATMGIPCYSFGSGYIAHVEPEQGLEDLKYTLAHETYHGIQMDLELRSCRDRRESPGAYSSRWLAEGAADYAAKMALSKINGDKPGLQYILKTAYQDFISGELELSTRQGSAALALMVLRGEIDEKAILGASMWSNCQSQDIYNDSNPIIQNAKKNWGEIKFEIIGGLYSFKETALD